MGGFSEHIERERRLTELLAPLVINFPYDASEIRFSYNYLREHFSESESLTKLRKLCQLAASAQTAPSRLILFWLLIK